MSGRVIQARNFLPSLPLIESSPCRLQNTESISLRHGNADLYIGEVAWPYSSPLIFAQDTSHLFRHPRNLALNTFIKQSPPTIPIPVPFIKRPRA